MPLAVDTSKILHDGERDTVNFRAADGETRVVCRVSREALNDYTGTSGSDLLDLFRAAENVIVATAERKYDAGALEEDGSILIRSAELR